MAIYYSVFDNDRTMGVVSERTNKGTKLDKVQIKDLLCKFYNVNETDIVFTTEEYSRQNYGFYGSWNDEYLIENAPVMEEEFLPLEETGMNYPEDNTPWDRWTSGRQISL